MKRNTELLPMYRLRKESAVFYWQEECKSPYDIWEMAFSLKNGKSQLTINAIRYTCPAWWRFIA